MLQLWRNERKKHYWVPYIIDSIKGIFGKRDSSYSKSNYSSVKK